MSESEQSLNRYVHLVAAAPITEASYGKYVAKHEYCNKVTVPKRLKTIAERNALK